MLSKKEKHGKKKITIEPNAISAFIQKNIYANDLHAPPRTLIMQPKVAYF